MNPKHLVLLKHVSLKGACWDASKVLKELEKWVANLEKYYGVRCKISIGSYHPELKGISQSYREAMLTSIVGEKLEPSKTVYLFEEYKLPVFIKRANELGIGEEMDPYYQQLKQNDKKGELVETLMAYIEENGDNNAVTGKLYIHRNTLRYRLDKITELTGKDPRKVKDLLELYLSIIQEQIK